MVYKRETEFFTPSLAAELKTAVVKYSLITAVGENIL